MKTLIFRNAFVELKAPTPEKVPEPAPPAYATVNKPVSSSTTTTAPRSVGAVKPQISPSGNARKLSYFIQVIINAPFVNTIMIITATTWRTQLFYMRKLDNGSEVNLGSDKS